MSYTIDLLKHKFIQHKSIFNYIYNIKHDITNTYTIFTVIAGSDGDSSDDDETQTIDINALNAEILNEDDEIQQMQNGTIDDVIAMETSTILGKINTRFRTLGTCQCINLK